MSDFDITAKVQDVLDVHNVDATVWDTESHPDTALIWVRGMYIVHSDAAREEFEMVSVSKVIRVVTILEDVFGDCCVYMLPDTNCVDLEGNKVVTLVFNTRN